MLQLAWPPFLYVLLLSLTVAFAVWTYRHTHALTRRQRLLLTLLRSTTLGLVLTLLADPLLVRTERRQTPPELALLIDDSASMPLAPATAAGNWPGSFSRHSPGMHCEQPACTFTAWEPPCVPFLMSRAI